MENTQKNIAIQFANGELVMFYTTSIERAKEVATHGGFEVNDVYEIRDDEMEFYCFDGRLHDNGKTLTKEAA